MPHVAIIGSGIAGMGAAHALQRSAVAVTLFEADHHFGGHANTARVTLEGITHGVDTGFLVYNERTYPRLIALFEELGVEVAMSEMSFSVQVLASNGGRSLEWSGTSLNALFAQRSNILRPRFWIMLWDIVRFNKLCTELAKSTFTSQALIGDFLQSHKFSDAFIQDYFLPMVACIWSCPVSQMMKFPVSTLIRFCHNHGLLQISNRPQWYTVRGGSAQYVDKLLHGIHDKRLNTPVHLVSRLSSGVSVHTERTTEHFDGVLFACHPDQALRTLGGAASSQETQILSAVKYQTNTAVLQTDTSVLPQHESAWAAWNYERSTDHTATESRVCLHYLINRLQPLPWQHNVIVSLNPIRSIDPAKLIQTLKYEHPVFDSAAIEAQQSLVSLQGKDNTWFCGAWCGYGFHEDGLRSGQNAAAQIIEHLTAQRSLKPA